ncbi:hypothetical protein [Thiomonas intermedia]|uniref:hypothetical protein n=1 Tax=Thiomonas intermedia TaxID=926 RepID=UPI0015D0AC30|nr:hypothetical protein [Thiomonas intermedia]
MASTQQISPASRHGSGVPQVRLPLPQAEPQHEGPRRAADVAAMRALRWARIAFGVCFAINLGLHFHPHYVAHFAAHFARPTAGTLVQPPWRAAWRGAVWLVLSAVGVNKALALLFGIEALLTVGLLTGWAFPPLGWLGLAYELFLWSTLGGGAASAAALVYALGFALLLLLRAWQGSAWSGAALGRPASRRVRWAFWLTGLLWAATAWAAWQPAIGAHLSASLAQAQRAAPDWQIEWIDLWTGLGHALGMEVLAVLVTAVGSLIAAGLLLAPWLSRGSRRMLLWGGWGFSLLAWSLHGGFGVWTLGHADLLSGAAIGAVLFALLLSAQHWLEDVPVTTRADPPTRRAADQPGVDVGWL